MSGDQLILDSIILLMSAVFFVSLFKLLKLGPVLGFIFAGVIIGPHCSGWVQNTSFVQTTAEFGIILLLFFIGLEVSPRRLGALRSKILFFGPLQVILTTLLLCFSCLLFKQDLKSSIIIGLSLSLSSTAYVLNHLKQSKELTLSYGQSSLGILLFQDLIIIPALAFLPFLSNQSSHVMQINYHSLVQNALILSAVIWIGMKITRKILGFIASTQNQEILLAASFLLVLSMSLLMQNMGLSKGLGAFLAGMFLSESEIRLDIEKIIYPFKGLLMGLFFISVGMNLNLNIVQERPTSILIYSSIFMGLKFGILFIIGKIKRLETDKSFYLGALLCQGGEFGFLLLSSAHFENIISQRIYDLLCASITLSMAIAPVIIIACKKIILDKDLNTKDITKLSLVENSSDPSDTAQTLDKKVA